MLFRTLSFYEWMRKGYNNAEGSRNIFKWETTCWKDAKAYEDEEGDMDRNTVFADRCCRDLFRTVRDLCRLEKMRALPFRYQ